MLRYANLISCLVLASTLLSGCSAPQEEVTSPGLAGLVDDLPALEGRAAYRQSPYVTAGDRVYLVGHQDGRFPNLGFHVEGEMGGLWNHPIKLMDGFTAQVADDASGTAACLDHATQFINYPLANKLVYEPPGLDVHVEQFQFVPDGLEGMVVEYALVNRSSMPRTVAFTFTGLVDLLPVWLSERQGIVDSRDRAVWDPETQAMAAQDSLNNWFVFFGSEDVPVPRPLENNACEVTRKGRGVDVALTYDLSIPPGETALIPFFIAGSYTSVEAARQTYQTLKQQPAALLEAKKARYATLRATADLSIPDPELEAMYTWMKYNTDWLIRDVPEVGRGISAGLPDYPWWFGADNSYTLQGTLATGRPDLTKATMRLLHTLSETTNGNGRIIHEVSTNGVVFNEGNLNETPHFAMLVWTAYEWTGDRELLAELYPTVKAGLDWMLTDQDQDRNLYPDGPGMMEIHGLDSEMIDVVVYQQQALEAAAKMAGVMNEPDRQRTYADLAQQLKDRINADWWVAEAQSFADFKATTRQTLELIDDALVRADTLNKPWAVEELQATRRQVATYPPDEKRGHVVHHNWVVNTPMEVGVADPDKALLALDTGRRYTNPFGVYVTGIDRTERQTGDLDSPNWQTFSYVGAVMTLPTGVQAIAEARYGRTEQAYDYLKMLAQSFSYALPGSMYEVSPDYGMMAQAWNLYSVAVPIVQHFFGIQPHAYDNHITVRPRMPTDWSNASLSNLPIGNNTLSIAKTTSSNRVTYTLEQQQGDWTIDFRLPPLENATLQVNGTPATPEMTDGDWLVRLDGPRNEVVVQE